MTNRVLENIAKSSNKPWLETNTCLLVRHGSRAYGTHTEQSDNDYKGIAIAPREYYLGNNKTFEQAIANEPDDVVIFEIKKFFKLATDANPNIIEVLHTDPSDYMFVSNIGKRILENKDLFITKKVKYTFLGYAISQLNRIKLHKKWIEKKDITLPTRKEFNLPDAPLIPKEQMLSANAEVQKYIDRLSFDFMDTLDETTKQEVRYNMNHLLSELKITSEEKWNAASRKIGLDENFIELMQKERQYSAKMKEWNSFLEWQKTRNPKRYADEVKFGFDCYSSDTEFLTKNGWKSFDDITSDDELATIFISLNHENSSMTHRADIHGVEYQKFIDKFDSMYNGPMYHFTGNHMDCLVTSNHRMLLQKEERKTGNKGSWDLTEAAHAPDTFNVIIAPTPKTKNFSNKEIFKDIEIKPGTYLSLMGWYLSDGTACFRNNKVKSLTISQKPGGKLCWHMSRFFNKNKNFIKCSIYEYEKKPNNFNPYFHREKRLSVRGFTAQKIITDCGWKLNKRIPRYVFTLSQKLMECLLMGMIRGDGTKKEHLSKGDSFVYYTNSKELANDVQELGIMCGWETALWGPYKNDDKIMYQIHLRKAKDRYKKLIRSKNVEKIEVENHRVVCFSVPNGTLITRRNGKVSFHGNCKHAYHLIRLCRMAEEILSTGKVLVKRPDREELLAIRNGAWSYEQILQFAKDSEEKMQELFNNSTIPKEPDREKIDKLLISLIEESI